MTGRRELVISSELASVATVGTSVRALCLEHGLAPEEASEIELAVVEAVNNAIEHAYAMTAGHEVVISIEVADGCVVSQIRDTGRAMPPGLLEAVPADLAYDPQVLSSVPEGGMGLFLIKQTMDEVRYETIDAHNVLTLLRRRGRDSEGTP